MFSLDDLKRKFYENDNKVLRADSQKLLIDQAKLHSDRVSLNDDGNFLFETVIAKCISEFDLNWDKRVEKLRGSLDAQGEVI